MWHTGRSWKALLACLVPQSPSTTCLSPHGLGGFPCHMVISDCLREKWGQTGQRGSYYFFPDLGVETSEHPFRCIPQVLVCPRTRLGWLLQREEGREEAVAAIFEIIHFTTCLGGLNGGYLGCIWLTLWKGNLSVTGGLQER